ncbi:MAG: bifunctional enoyl-CoA hydratase/phosphate acetyltransferase [Minwuia sp.]|uniref:bifunctional enoyl-CoA hydratase/phosphate acetyltransferase n=1 Tax=Minwuia sp. TaxID=2493630 RepID=UPI003A8A96F3
MSDSFQTLIDRAAGGAAIPTAVVHPCSVSALEGALEAGARGLIVPILVGPQHRIDALAAETGADLTAIERVDTAHSHESAAKAVELVRTGRAQALMKGSLHTDELMHEILVKESGLRTERRLSHVFALEIPKQPHLFFVTDAAINIQPDLLTKADIVRNAIDCVRALGIETPKVAILSAVETVTPRIPSTIEAAALCKMADRGQITGGLLDGPLAIDNALSVEAAETKGIRSPVAGHADILVAPDMEAGNMIAKQLTFLAGAQAAGVVMGARVPVVLTSRADGPAARLASAAIAVLIARAREASLAADLKA